MFIIILVWLDDTGGSSDRTSTRNFLHQQPRIGGKSIFLFKYLLQIYIIYIVHVVFAMI